MVSDADGASPNRGSEDRRPTLWRWLARRVDFASERPRRHDDLEVTRLESEKLGTYYIVKNPRRGRYLKLTAEDHFLFSRMDGEHSVRDLLLAYYHEFGALAFRRTAGLIQELKEGGFLHQEQPRLLTFLRRQCRRRDWLGRLAHVGQTILHKELAIRGVDTWVSGLYRYGGWVFFTRPAQLLAAGVVGVGLVLFLGLFVGGSFTLVSVDDSYLVGGVLLGALQLAVIFIHEHAHALATRHFGREVTRGGFLLYLGLPAFFVDTSDIWMSPKRARLLVSWAGPYSELILGGLASILAWWLGPTVVGSILFKFALLLYLGAFLNLNPLLELDGYYMLMDWLEVPMLRQRSFRFLKETLWGKLRRRASFTGEERLFTWFGLLSLAYTVFALGTALYVYLFYAWGAVRGLWREHGPVVRVLIVAAYAAVLGPLVYFVVFRVIRGLRAALSWARRKAVFEDPYRMSALVVLLALVAWRAPRWAGAAYDLTIYGVLLGVVLVLLTAGAVLLLRWYDDPLPQTAAGLFAAWSAGLLTAEIAQVVGYRRVGLVAFTVAWAAFFGSSLVSWRMTSAFRFRWQDLPAVALVAVGSGLVGLYLSPAEHPVRASAWIFAAPVLASLGLGFMTVTAWTYRRTVMALPVGVGWSGLAAGVVVALWPWPGLGGDVAAGSVALEPGVFAGVLVVGSVGLVRSAFRQLARARVVPSREALLSDADRLADAFSVLVSSVLRQFRAFFGRRVVQVLEEELRQRKDFPSQVTIRDTVVTVELRPGESILALAQRLRWVMQAVFGEVRRYLRDAYLSRLVERVFAELSWDEREAASQYLLVGGTWEGALAKAHQETRENYAELLARNPLFSELTTKELAGVAGRLQAGNFRAGSTIVRQGEPGSTFYIIAAGRVDVLADSPEGPQKVGELAEGDYFGEIALLRPTARTASCVARTEVEVLTLGRADFTRLLAHHFGMGEKVKRVAAISSMLRHMPLFADFSAKELQALVGALGTETMAAGRVVIRRGDPGERFFIIASGAVEVRVGEGVGEERVVARLGRGEYFGEIALLADVPRTATVRTVTECEFFVLDRDEFQQLIRTHVLAVEQLQQVSSRRMLDTRRKLVGGAVTPVG